MDINDPVIPNILKHGSELKRVNLTLAREFNEPQSTINATSFFENSGLELLRDIILKELGEDNIKSCFFEYSTLCSTIGSDILSAFLCVWQKENHLDIKTLEGDLDNIIKTLFAESLSLYYLPKFFIQPDEDKANITILPDFKSHKRYTEIAEDFNKYLDKFNSAIQINPEQIKYRPLSEIEDDKKTFVQNLSLSNVDYELVKERSVKFHRSDPLPNHLLLHHLYDEKLYKNRNENYKTILISIPMLGAPFLTSTNQFNGQGALFLYLITDKQIDESFRNKITSLVKSISETNKDLTYNYLFDVGYRFAKEAKRNSIKAAISQVIDRQMSHNINSHVLANLVTKDDLQPALIRPFLKYLQTRIEFIADIVTTEPLITFPSAIKDDILSRFSNMKNGKPESTGNNEKEGQAYLLKYISGSSEVTYDDSSESKKNIKIEFEGDENTKAAIPNDILGAQAFYVILENIIRNSVKHCLIPTITYEGDLGKVSKKNLCLTISAEKFDHEYLKVVIRDNLGIDNSIQRNRKDFSFLAERNLDFITWMNKKIDRAVLDNTGKLREGDWGLLEMKICSAYLRKFPLVDLDNEANPRLFNISLMDNNIGYEFFLLRPKLACIVFNAIPGDLDVKKFEDSGIDIVSKDDVDFNLLLHYGILKKNSDREGKTSHKYLIVEKGVFLEDKKYDSNQPMLLLSTEEICKILNGSPELAILKHFFHGDVVKEMVFLDDTKPTPKNSEENKAKLIFHFHADRESNKELFENYPKYLDYYEPYSTQSATVKLKKDYDEVSEEAKEILKLEMNLAAKLEVAILDERIQSEACKINAVHTSNVNINRGDKFQILEGMKVFIPEEKSEFNLNANSFLEGAKEEERISYKIKEWIKLKAEHCNYILIHQGIIEKLLGSTDVGKIENFVRDFEKQKAKLIIISGRGKPSNLPNDVFYLPFSLVNQYVVSYRSKIYLYKLLISARRYRHD